MMYIYFDDRNTGPFYYMIGGACNCPPGFGYAPPPSDALILPENLPILAFLKKYMSRYQEVIFL
jgi:hypothetical protein